MPQICGSKDVYNDVSVIFFHPNVCFIKEKFAQVCYTQQPQKRLGTKKFCVGFRIDEGCPHYAFI